VTDRTATPDSTAAPRVGARARLVVYGRGMVAVLSAARTRARAGRRPELVVYGILLGALLLGIEFDVGRRLGGVLFLALLIPLHVFAGRKAAAAAASRKE
jgi:hypothetical protein